MADLIVAMLIINGLVAVVAIFIAVAQQKFHKKVEERLSEAIVNSEKLMTAQVIEVKSLVKDEIEQSRTNIRLYVGTEMEGMEKRFYAKLDDPKTFDHFYKRITQWAQSRWIDVAVFQMWKTKGLTRSAFEIKVSRSDFISEMRRRGLLGTKMS